MSFKLFQSIINLSESDDWHKARKEWEIRKIIWSEERQTCVCGHYPIKELIYITNKKNYYETIIGNCCINKLLEDNRYNKIFKAIKEDRLNKALIELARDDKIIRNDNEYEFLLNIWRKRRLSIKQQDWYNNLKKRILTHYVRSNQ